MLMTIPVGWIWPAVEALTKPSSKKGWPPPTGGALKLLSVVIPARDETDNVESTVEHLHLELAMQEVPHEIVVVDDGSSDNTWHKLQQLAHIAR